MADDKDILGKANKILKESLLPNTDLLIGKIKEVDSAAYEVVKAFGLSNTQVMSLKAGLTGAVTEVQRLGGEFQNVIEIQKGIGTGLQRSLILTSDAFGELYAAQEVTGIQAGSIASNFKDAGFSAYNAGKEMEMVVQTAQSIGVNVEQVSSAVMTNIGQLNRFNFKGGVDGLAKMAAQATNLRIDMKTTMDFAENVFEPEGAIEMAANMQRLGVTVGGLTDATQLMYNSANNPAKLQDDLTELAKSFVKMDAAGNFKIMPGAKRYLRELNNGAKLPLGTLQKMGLAAKELEKKMSQIRMPPGLNLSKEQQQLIANMSEMKDGVATVKFTDEKGKDQTKKVIDLNKSDLAALAETNKPKSIEEIQKGQLSIQKQILAALNAVKTKTAFGVAGSKSADDLLKMSGKVETIFYDGISAALGPTSKISTTVDKTSDVLLGSMNDLINGKKDFTEVFTNIGALGDELSISLKDNFKTSIDNASDSVKTFMNSNNKFAESLKTAINKISTVGNNSQTDTTPKVNVPDFIKTPGMGIETLPQDTIFGGTGFESFIDGIKEMKSIPNNVNVGNNQFEDFMNNMKGMKSPINNTNEPQTPVETKTTADINFNITIDAPSQIDTNQILLALDNQGVKQKLVESMKEGMYNNGLTAPTSSKSRLMNPYLNS
ncbi:hypothetical protein N9P74_00175 [bacterium]|nr:hypothetical protein [bacterium]MDB4235075.1 hypothetical protein [bacterium]MDB4352039.1 hypothetical protein [Porticoccaceae bacterium]